jgi:hypothetical protein
MDIFKHDGRGHGTINIDSEYTVLSKFTQIFVELFKFSLKLIYHKSKFFNYKSITAFLLQPRIRNDVNVRFLIQNKINFTYGDGPQRMFMHE